MRPVVHGTAAHGTLPYRLVPIHISHTDCLPKDMTIYPMQISSQLGRRNRQGILFGQYSEELSMKSPPSGVI
jgi:hypothetical protein